MQCVVLNPMDKPVKLRADTPIGSLHSISVVAPLDAKVTGSKDVDYNMKKLTHKQMQKEHESLRISFADCAAKNEDF